MHAERGSHFFESEQALSAHPTRTVFEAVCRTQLPHDPGSQPVGDARRQAARGEDVGDLAVGMSIEQAVDFGDYIGAGFPQLCSVEGERKLEGVDGAAAEANVIAWGALIYPV